MGGHEIINVLSSCPVQSLHTKFGQDWPSSSWEKDVDGWWTMDTDGCQPIEIHVGHLSVSGDLKANEKFKDKQTLHHRNIVECKTCN